MPSNKEKINLAEYILFQTLDQKCQLLVKKGDGLNKEKYDDLSKKIDRSVRHYILDNSKDIDFNSSFNVLGEEFTALELAIKLRWGMTVDTMFSLGDLSIDSFLKALLFASENDQEILNHLVMQYSETYRGV